MHRIRLPALVACVLLSACAASPEQASAPSTQPAAAPERMVETIRAEGRTQGAELAVQPLRDPMVEDLRESAQQLETQHKYADAAAKLDQALAITPDDPAVIQERAEAAILLKDYAGAEQRARHAFEIGSKVGPLCRRHWATVRQIRYAQGDGAGAAQANQQMQACKVDAPPRY